MTYFNFLALFIVLPGLWLTWRARPTRAAWAALGGLLLITYLWTTPWDNYLVGSGVWYYDPRLVSGLVFGWVPLEEYLFFGLQVWFSGMWVLSLQRFQAAVPITLLGLAALGFGPLWLIQSSSIPSGQPAADLPPLPFGSWNYLVLISVWAVPVIVGQWVIGAEIFRAHWRTWALGVFIPALYLTTIDAIAIGGGTWTIAPQQSLQVFFPGGVPLEEGLFFLATQLMVVQGWLLLTSPAMHHRARQWWRPRASA